MFVVTPRAPVADIDPPTAPTPPRIGTVLMAPAFAALAVMVGSDGTPWWQVVRVAIVTLLGAGAVVVSRRVSVRAAGWLWVVIGVVVLAAGIGFGPHVFERPASLLSVAALVAVVGGVALAVAGTVTRSAGRRGLRRAIAGLATLLVAAVVASVVAPAVAVTNVPRPVLGAPPSSVGLVAEEVTLHAGDGVELAAWYVPSSNRAAVVLRHGAGSTRSDVLDEAAVLARHGFGVLLVDARGHGASGGRAMDFGWNGDADIAAATAYLASRDDVDAERIGVVGSSMGGEEAIGASASNPLIRAVVAEGATARTAADKEWLSQRYGLRGLLQEQVERLQFWVTDVLTEASSPIALRAAVGASGGTRYLLIAAGNVADEAHAAAYLAAAAPDRVETWVIDGAGHTGGLDVAADEWETRVITFLSDALAVPGRR